jgi:hypothetical protein
LDQNGFQRGSQRRRKSHRWVDKYRGEKESTSSFSNNLAWRPKGGFSAKESVSDKEEVSIKGIPNVIKKCQLSIKILLPNSKDQHKKE